MEEKLPAGVREQMPQRYLELEAVRLMKLVTEWLEFERERVAFSVARTELDVSRSHCRASAEAAAGSNRSID